MGEPLRELGKLLLTLGIILGIAGLVLMSGARLPLRLGRLPGDVAYSGRHGTVYFPVATCIVLSVVLTLILWFVNFLRR